MSSTTRTDRPARCRWLAVAIGGMLTGCGGGDESLEQLVQAAGDSQGARESPLEPLRLEVERIENAGQSPRRLSPPAFRSSENAATLLSDALTEAARLRLYPKLDDLIPDERFEFDPEELQKARDLVNAAEALREKFSQAGRAVACDFLVRHDLGFFGRMRFLDEVAIVTRMHLLAAAPALDESDFSAALKELDAAMRWADRLARVERIEARLRAVQLRGECLTVVEAIADDPGVQQTDYERLYGLLRRSLAAWPDEAGPLIGDRAVTMHSYEAIRLGLFDKLATTEEKKLLERRGKLDRLRSMAHAEIDRDQLSYLIAMQKLIDAAPQPFHQRAETIRETLDEFDVSDGGAARAPLAAHLFVPGLRAAIREIARDRAACEAWAIAVAAAGGLELPPYRRNPVTGAEYEIDRLDGALIVRVGDPDLREPYARTIR